MSARHAALNAAPADPFLLMQQPRMILASEAPRYAERINRADAIMARAFPPIRTPHGFYDADGFFAAMQRAAARKIIRSALIQALPLSTETKHDKF